jgi:hypothetical protein
MEARMNVKTFPETANEDGINLDAALELVRRFMMDVPQEQRLHPHYVGARLAVERLTGRSCSIG